MIKFYPISDNNHDSRIKTNKSFTLIFLIIATNALLSVQAFHIGGGTNNKRSTMKLNVVPLTEDDSKVSSTAESDSTPSLMFNASESIGSLLMQMQKKEAELNVFNKSLLDEDQAFDISSFNATATSNNGFETKDNTLNEEKGKETTKQKGDIFSWMRKQERETGTDTSSDRQSAIDAEIAKELDDSVSIRITNSLKDITLLELPEVCRITTPTVNNDKEEEKTDLPLLSRAEHYDGRIGRDMRHLAVSVVSSIDDVAEWQLFCEQNSGGLEPLIECIRDGATSIREGSDEKITSKSQNNRSDHYLEVSFQAASSACRALRDLCALSLDLAAVITDGLLRANTAYKNKGEYTLMEDLCTILRHADDLSEGQTTPGGKASKWSMGIFRGRSEARLRSKLYVTQLLLAMTCASDCAVDAIRSTAGLQDVLLVYSSYVRKERRRRWMRYPGELIKSVWLAKKRKSQRKDDSLTATQNTTETRRQPFIEAASLKNDLNGRIQGTANQVLAAIGYNEWVPKIPGQKGLRILTLDGGGSRGMTSVVAMKAIVDSLGGMEIADCFDLVVGTSTGAIIAFLVGLNRETSEQAVERYDDLIGKIFTKSAFSTPMLLFTTATYDESPFMNVLTEILGDNTMLDSRANPAVPFVFAVTSKMSSSPTHIALFRNYNYNGGEQPDPFMIDPDDARENLGLLVQDEAKSIRMNSYPKKEKSMDPSSGSRHPGSFRVLQKHALRASTAAPTVFKPVLMGGEMYCDGGIVGKLRS
jgi:hypothetical protein